MSSDDYGLIELLLVFGAILAVAVYELLSLRRSRRRDAEREGADQNRR